MLVVDAFGKFNKKHLIIGWSVDDEIKLKIGLKKYFPDRILRIKRDDVNEVMKLDKNYKSGFLILVDEMPEYILNMKKKVKLEPNDEKFNNVLNEYLSKDEVKKFLGINIEAFIDYIIKITDGYYFITGWAVSKEGNELKIKSNSDISYSFYSREDLKEINFVKEKYKNAGFYLIIKAEDKAEITFFDENGNEKMIVIDLIPNKEYDSIKEMSEFIFSFIDITKKGFSKQFEKILGAVLKKAYLNYYNSLDLEIEEKIYGEIPKNSKLSIIVPLYGRVDFVEFQSAVFSADRDFLENVELIYVLDDPDRFYSVIDSIMDGAYNIYRVPFKCIKYNYNLGYARANNVGVRFASADKILLLNSDVFPKEKGWVSKILDIYKNLENPGVLGFKLLYEDDSIQHVGMEFRKYKYLDDMWINYHPFKGMPDNHKKELKEVEAVTGACMLLEKDKYFEVGGLSEQYILGDFEDSDLCLKLRAKGYKIYYSSEPSFYHLERQSQNLFDNKEWKHKITVFNCWQHTNKWNDLLEKVKNESVNS